MMGRRVATAFVFALFAACGSSSEEGLYTGSGGHTNGDASVGGAAGSIASGGSIATGGGAGSTPTGGSAGNVASGGSAGVPLVDAGPDVPTPPPVDAGPDGNNPVACPPNMPAGGSPCNIFVNVTDCVYGIKHCVCTVTTWLCVP